MVIVGAKGLAKEVLEIFAQRNQLDSLFFFDDISNDLPELLFDRFPVIRSMEALKQTFAKTGDHSFTLGLGNPVYRAKFARLISDIGGKLTSAIDPHAHIGTFGNRIGEGCTILSGSVVTNGVTIGRGVLINPLCSISHDAILDDFIEMSPGVRITGENVVVGAGAVVIRDVADNTLVAGVPAVVKKKLDPIQLDR
jgi:acetyltransferase-like isoleucine patch superfamily enzyme